MTRFILLLFFVFPTLCFSQNEKLPKSEKQISSGFKGDVNSHQYELNKAALQNLTMRELIELGYINPNSLSSPTPPGYSNSGNSRAQCNETYIPVDQATYTAVPRNDDGSLHIPDIGFTFSFCGATYTELYINTNGNLSFEQPLNDFNPDGFPYPTPMIAPFWADVDTRNTACGQAWYKLFPNYMIVSWEEVGWYNQQCDPLNTFQVIISDGTADIIGIGNNIQFRYDDMDWTTGQASPGGAGPFGGFPATVGFNSGDNVNYEQVGRFNVDSYDYDGPFGNNDGVHWLDYRCFVFNSAGGGNLQITCQDIVRSLDDNCSITIIPEDVATASVEGCLGLNLTLDINTFSCVDEGDNTVTVTATSGGQTVSCTAIVTITTENCPAVSINQVGPFCQDDPPQTLNASPPGGTWGGAAPSGTFDPGNVSPGTYTITYENDNSCPTTTSIDVVVYASPDVSIAPDPAEFCEDEGSILLTATGSGGDGNLSYNWSTPEGNSSGTTYNAIFPGLHTITVVDGNGCDAVASVEVFEYPNPQVVIVNPGPICETNTIYTLTAAPSGGTWEGSIISPEGDIYPVQTGPGIYTVSYSYINSFGCEGSDNIDIEITATPASFPSNGGPYCEGDPISLFGDTDANGSVIQYNWTGPNNYSSNSQNPTNATSPGMYILQVIVDGCPSNFEVTQVIVTPTPEAIAINNGPYCEGSPIQLIGSTPDVGNNITYQWSGPNNYFSTEQNPIDATSGGIYTLTVTIDGCPSPPATTNVVVSSAPDALAENGGPYCTGDLIFLMGSTNSSGNSIIYTWSGPNNYSSFVQNPVDATELGTYSLTVIVDGCSSEITETEVILNPLPQPNISGSNTFCENGSTVLDAGPYVSFLWTGNSTGQTLEVFSEGDYFVTVTDANGCTGTDQIFVEQTESLNPVILGDLDICQGESSTLDAGVGYTTYLWSNNETTQTIDVNAEIEYSVTVSDNSGCTGETAITLIVNDLPSVNITGDDSFCEGASSVLNGGVFSSYLWSDNSTNQTLEVFDPGIYAITVTDANGCSGEDDIVLTEISNPNPVISGPNSFCTGNSATLDGGVGYSTYLWSNNETTQTITVSSGGTIGLTVTDSNGCVGNTNFDLIENASLTPQITGDLEICDGENSTLDAGSGYTTYLWSNNEITQTINVDNANNYSVTVSDTNGCTGETTASLVINNNPTVNITGDDSFCEGASSILNGGVFSTYLWSDSSSNQTLEVFDPGTYAITVTDANGCSGEDDIILTENPNPNPVISGPNSFCTGNSATLDGGVGYSTYLWSNNETTQTITVSSGGTIGLTVTDSNGCVGNTNFDLIENASLTPQITGDLEICDGENSILDAGTGYATYLWSNNETTQTIDVDDADDYSVTVSDISGCTGETTASLVVNNNPSVNISGDDSFCEGASSVLNTGVFSSYLWSDNTTNQTLEVFDSGNYSVTVTDTNGCTDEDEIIITENLNPVPNITGPSSFCSGNSTTLDGGNGYDAYLWSTNEITQSITVSSGGNIGLTVTDSNGCVGETSIDVIENATLTPEIAGDLEFCSGLSSILDAGAGYATYEWSNGETTQTIEVSNNGSVGVVVTDQSGCSGSDNVLITVFNNPNPTIGGSTTYCVGGFTVLNAGTGYASYLWSNNEQTQTITVSAPGNYSVEVVNQDGCSGTAFVDVEESTSLNPVISGELVFCESDFTILDAGTGFDTYLWTDNSIGQTLQVNTPGDYGLTVTDGQGCSGETTVTVNEITPPFAVLQADTSVCNTLAGGSFLNLYNLIQSGDTNGSWTDLDNSGAVGLFNNLNFNAIQAGVYNFIYTTNSAVYPCPETSYQISVTVIDCSCPDVAFFNADPLCNGGETLDLSTVENTLEEGSWSISLAPPGINPAVVNGSDFDATGADVGEYILQFELLIQPPPGCSQTYFMSVFVEEGVDAGTADLPLSYCFNDNEVVALDGMLIGGNSGGTWSETSSLPSQGNAFDPAAGTFSTDGQQPGNYTFQYTVQSAGACPDDFEEVVVIVNQLPEVIAGDGVELNCYNPSLNLDASGSSSGAGFDINWTGPGIVIDGNENSLNPTVDQSGSYTLIIINTNTGCSASDLVQVTDNFDLPQVIAGNDENITCEELIVALSAQGDIGAGFEITWQGPGINAGNMNDLNPSVDEPGIYTITVMDLANGCFSPTDELEVFDQTIAPDIFVQLPLEDLDCNTASLDLTGGSLNNGVSFQWMFENNVIGTDAILEGATAPGVYTFIVTDNQSGCTASETIEVFDNSNYPNAEAGLPQLLNCYDTQVMLDGSNSDAGPDIIYQWTGPAGGILGSNTGITITAVLPGTYTISVENLANGCITTDEVNVTQDIAQPDAVIAATDELDCTVTEVALDGSLSSSGNNITYAWTDNSGNVFSNNQSTIVENPGIYILSVLNTENGCFDEASITVLENENVPYAAILTIEDPSCFGDTDGFIAIQQVLGGSAPYLFSLNNAALSSANLYASLSPGAYNLALEDANGCTWDTTVVIVEPMELNLDLGPDIELEFGDIALVNALVNIPQNQIDTIIWRPDDLVICDDLLCLEGTVNTFNTMAVSATLVDENGCVDTDDVMIVVNKDRRVYIPTAFSPNGDGDNDIFFINADLSQVIKVNRFAIFNRWGEVMFEATDFHPNDPLKGWDGTFKTESLNPSVFVYFAEIEFIDGHVEMYKGDVTLLK